MGKRETSNGIQVNKTADSRPKKIHTFRQSAPFTSFLGLLAYVSTTYILPSSYPAQLVLIQDTNTSQ